MFDPAARGLLGLPRPRGRGRDRADAHPASTPARIDGIKISLLDAGREVALRRRLPEGVLMFTGDDFNYAELIEGDALGISHAPARHLRPDRARRGGGARSARRRATGRATAPSWPPPCRCRARSSRRRRSTTRRACVLLAWLNGHQDHFVMVGGMQSARSACTTPRCSGSPTPPACCATRTSPAPGCEPDGGARRRLTARPPRFREPRRRREAAGTPQAQPWMGPASTPRPWVQGTSVKKFHPYRAPARAPLRPHHSGRVGTSGPSR